jgi:hypothetical protein
MNNYSVIDLHVRFMAINANVRYFSLVDNYIYELEFQILCEADLM